ncbi:erythromycin resistance leader peptide [Robertmurraya sp. 2P01SA]
MTHSMRLRFPAVNS